MGGWGGGGILLDLGLTSVDGRATVAGMLPVRHLTHVLSPNKDNMPWIGLTESFDMVESIFLMYCILPIKRFFIGRSTLTLVLLNKLRCLAHF